MKKKLLGKNIIWDIDDTLVNTSKKLILFFNKHTGKQVLEGHYSKFEILYGISSERVNELFDAFAKQNILRKQLPIPGMQKIIKQLTAEGFTHKAATARPRSKYEQQTLAYFDRFFPGTFHPNDVFMHEHNDEQVHHADKVAMVQAGNGNVFIDDTPAHAIAVYKALPEVLVLFKEHSKKPVHDISNLPKGIIVVRTPEDIKNAIDNHYGIDKKATIDVSVRDFNN